MVSTVLLQALFLVAIVSGAVVWIWHATDPDPESGRVCTSIAEQQRADARLPWISAVLADLTARAGIPGFREPRLANFGAHYRPIDHRVCVSRAMCARLDDADLRLILAHEVGHATRRWRTWVAFSEASNLREELHADSFALMIIGVGAEAWLRAVKNAQAIEPSSDGQIHSRALALGLSLEK